MCDKTAWNGASMFTFAGECVFLHGEYRNWLYGINRANHCVKSILFFECAHIEIEG